MPEAGQRPGGDPAPQQPEIGRLVTDDQELYAVVLGDAGEPHRDIADPRQALDIAGQATGRGPGEHPGGAADQRDPAAQGGTDLPEKPADAHQRDRPAAEPDDRPE